MTIVAEQIDRITGHIAEGARGLRSTVWLASYPRSGNSLVRLIAHHCLGLLNCGLYSESRIATGWPETVGLVDINRARAIDEDSNPILWKTHREAFEEDVDVPAIVIVRDPRTLYGSLQQFYRERNELDYDLAQLISGRHPWGDWSSWVRSWVAYGSNRTLWLRYEDVRVDTRRAIDRIAEFLCVEVQRYDLPAFDQLHQRIPTLFASGHRRGMNGEDEERLLRTHGAMMSLLGY